MSEIKHQRSAVANRNMKSISVAGMNGSRASLGRGIRINSAKDLTVYRTAYQLAMEIFELSKHFPAEEKFALTTQIRRSSRSICLNLLEAWAKRRYEAHFVSKLTDCDGENSEIDSSLDLWAIELLISGRRPRCPCLLLLLTAALFCLAGWMVLNARSIYDPDFSVFVPLRNVAPRLAGSVDYAISAAWMIRGALLLGAILFIADLSQSSRWLLRLWYLIGLVAGSIAFLGLLQKATGAEMIFWQPPPPEDVRVTTFFATYYYHGNAGAFLNSVWPLSAGLVIRAFTNRSHPGMRAVWVSLFFLTIAAVLANTSRMAQFVAVVLMVAICVQFGPMLLRRLSGAEKSVALAGALAILLSLIALAQAAHFEQPLNRWQSASERIPNDARWLASRVAMRALPESGFFGSGPGTFRAIFPAYNAGSANPVPGIWRFLHEDYLQTLMEWGWLGSAL